MPEVTSVKIEQDECIACEQCINECDAAFEMADDKVVVKPAAKDPAFCKQHSDEIVAASEACPSSAIKYETA
jgi:ferredoxin